MRNTFQYSGTAFRDRVAPPMATSLGRLASGYVYAFGVQVARVLCELGP